MTTTGDSMAEKPDVKQLMSTLDASLATAFRTLEALRMVSVDERPLLDLSKALASTELLVGDLKTSLRGLIDTIVAERYYRWRTQERYYVYISFRFNEERAPSMHALGEASGSSWHDLHFAALHWQRMEQMNERPGRKGGVIHYAIMAYNPESGQIRKVEQSEIDAALKEKPTRD
jgi:hypothetical protein